MTPGTRVRVTDHTNGYAGLVGTVTDDSTSDTVYVAVITGDSGDSHQSYQLLHLTPADVEVLS